MFSGITINRCLCIVLAIFLCFIISSCNELPNPTKPDKTESSDVTSDTIPDGYIPNSDLRDGEYNGRVCKDQLFLNLDGKQYLVLGEYIASADEYSGLGSCRSSKYLDVYYSDEDIKGLKVGEEFVFDSDISFVIESLEETGSKIPFHDAPNGMIKLNDYFCLLHGEYIRDDNDNIIDDSLTKKWFLTTQSCIRMADIDSILPVNKHVLYELSDKCIYKCLDPNEDQTQIISRDEIDKIFKSSDYLKSKYAYCELIVRRNQIVEVFFDAGA